MIHSIIVHYTVQLVFGLTKLFNEDEETGDDQKSQCRPAWFASCHYAAN